MDNIIIQIIFYGLWISAISFNLIIGWDWLQKQYYFEHDSNFKQLAVIVATFFVLIGIAVWQTSTVHGL